MNEMDFTRYIEELFAYYNARIPGRRTLDLWHEMTQFVPAEAMPWILRRVWETNESMPRNVPREIRELWQAWLQAHPEKRDRREAERDCPDCEGGWLSLYKPVEGYKIPLSFSAPCGRCKQVRAGKYILLAEAIAQGYKRQNLREHTTAGARDIKSLASKIGKEMQS